MKLFVAPLSTNQLHLLYKKYKKSLKQRLQDFKAIPSSEYFYELCYCLLTPQSKAQNAMQVVTKLKEMGFQDSPFNPESLLRNPAHYIRFHKTKAHWLLLAQQQWNQIKDILETKNISSNELRVQLVHTVTGFGFKEATHFMRNIGKNRGLVILDRHILRMLQQLHIIETIPASLTQKKYEMIELSFQQYAKEQNIPTDELDLLFWFINTGLLLK